jgi:hypothetical protein
MSVEGSWPSGSALQLVRLQTWSMVVGKSGWLTQLNRPDASDRPGDAVPPNPQMVNAACGFCLYVAVECHVRKRKRRSAQLERKVRLACARFCATVKRVREEKHLSIEQVSEASGLSKCVVESIEVGRSRMLLGQLERLATGLGMSLADLLRRSGS